MDQGTLIIAAISLLICSLPFVLAAKNRKSCEKILRIEIEKLAQQNSKNLDFMENVGNNMLALAVEPGKLFFARRTIGGKTSGCVELKQYKKCEVATVPSRSGGSSQEQIGIRFLPVREQDKSTTITLYETTESMPQSGELQMAMEWTERINKFLINS